MIITLGRQHGSNGHDIARALAKELDYRCFDKEIVEEAAENSHFSKEIFDSYDEKRVNAYIVPVPHYVGMNEGFRLNMQVATAQFDVMRSLAEKGNCIFVGRCADYILKDRPDCLHIFIHADMEHRAARVRERYGETKQPMEKRLQEKDSKRKVYYKHYTNRNWGEADNYDVCLDSGALGVDKCVDIVCDIAEMP